MTRLLIIKPSSLGDIVHGLQLAATLQAQVPSLEIDWVARDRFAPLVRQSPLIRQVHEFARGGGAGRFVQLLRELRREHYDFVFDLQGLLRSGIMTAAARARRKVGRSDAREGARWFYRERVPLPAAGRQSHALEVLLQFAPVLGARADVPRALSFRPGGAVGAPALPPHPILLFPDSRRPEKCWPHFAALTEQLLARQPGPVVWAGQGRQEGDPRWPAERFVNVTAMTPLTALPDLLRGARLVVGNDSGPMHLAAALDVPVVALFGPTDPARFGPYPVGAPGRIVLRAPAGDLTRLSAVEVVERLEALGL